MSGQWPFLNRPEVLYCNRNRDAECLRYRAVTIYSECTLLPLVVPYLWRFQEGVYVKSIQSTLRGKKDRIECDVVGRELIS